MDFQSIALPPELQHRFPFGIAKVVIFLEAANLFANFSGINYACGKLLCSEVESGTEV